MIAGCSMRLSTPPSDSAQAKMRTRLEERASPPARPPWMHEGEHPAEARSSAASASACCGCDGEARVDDLLDLRVRVEEAAPRCSAFCGVALHADVERLQAAQDEEAVHRARARRRPRSAGTGAARASASSLVMTAPPTTSEWPFRYLVVEWTTTSTPSSSGRWKNGRREGVVDDRHRAVRPARSPRRAARSTSLSIGLVGVSTQTSFVFGRERPLDVRRVGHVDVA